MQNRLFSVDFSEWLFTCASGNKWSSCRKKTINLKDGMMLRKMRLLFRSKKMNLRTNVNRK